jgi:hypothetical protein
MKCAPQLTYFSFAAVLFRGEVIAEPKVVAVEMVK